MRRQTNTINYSDSLPLAQGIKFDFCKHVCTGPPFLFASTPSAPMSLALAGLGSGLPHRTESVICRQGQAIAHQGLRHRVSESGRLRRRAGQERRAHRCPARAGLRLRRNRHGHATPAAGQSEAAHVPPAGEEAVINRLGFNNQGVDALVRNVERAQREGILGINIGKNKDTPNEQRGRRLPVLPGTRLRRWPTTSPSTSPRPTPRPARSAEGRSAARIGRHDCARPRKSWPACTARGCRCW